MGHRGTYGRNTGRRGRNGLKARNVSRNLLKKKKKKSRR